ncbi:MULTISPECIES: helix-turn-helix domain-containing protein [Streptomyces]|uniref:helix-turn-helix domain-containing protein n=1 Tax=Streptomyces TaxID=1883 RepID=UPI001F464F59|nr:helix-turn-helix transcriptional regulator [Streptomyces noursei]MCE4942295.1 helix-turn-helix transcriptional regulator [Streptomyces noursei]
MMNATPHVGQNSPDDAFLQLVYGAVCGPFGEETDAAEIATELGVPLTETTAALTELTALGLLRNGPNQGWVAISPHEAVSRVIGPLEHEMHTRRLQIERARRRMMSFASTFDTHARGGGGQIELIEDLADVRRTIAELSARAKREILTAQPGGGRREDVLVEAAPRDYDTLRRGVTMRMLYQHTARSSLGTQSYVEQVTRLGAQVRTLDDQFMRFLVFDRECAVFAVPQSQDAAVLVRDPYVVDFITDVYERMWLTAVPFTVDADTQPEITHDVKEAIIRLLTAGLTDAAVARRLGMSVRTCRRHVAEIMAALGAESRFQAGYLLAVHE